MTNRSADIETVVIGGGIIGLAIAAECAKAGQETYVLERHNAIGQKSVRDRAKSSTPASTIPANR